MTSADLRFAELGGVTAFRTCLRDACLVYANLRRVDLYQVVSLQGVHWYDAFLDHTRIKRESLGKRIGDELTAHDSKGPEDYHRAKEAYLLLKNNFNQIGRYEDASWAYVKEQQMEKMGFYWEHRWRLLRPWWRVRRWRFLFQGRYLRKSAWGRPPHTGLCGRLLRHTGHRQPLGRPRVQRRYVCHIQPGAPGHESGGSPLGVRQLG
jgi:hypothetical protein